MGETPGPDGNNQSGLSQTPPAGEPEFTPACGSCERYLASWETGPDHHMDIFDARCAEDGQGHGGHFDFRETPDGITGKYPENGDPSGTMPCEGRDFVLNPHKR